MWDTTIIILFYPNLKYLVNNPQWERTGPISQPTLILYGKNDTLESEESYNKLLAKGFPGPIHVIGYKGAFRKFDELGNLRDIVEKPTNPPSSIAIGGIYLYDERFWDILDKNMAEMGEHFTITDVNRNYIELDGARMRELITEEWYDCGTPDSLLKAAELARDGKLNPEPCNIRHGDPEPNSYAN